MLVWGYVKKKKMFITISFYWGGRKIIFDRCSLEILQIKVVTLMTIYIFLFVNSIIGKK